MMPETIRRGEKEDCENRKIRKRRKEKRTRKQKYREALTAGEGGWSPVDGKVRS